MANWHVFSADHQIPGRILLDLAKAVGSEEIMPYYEKHGMTHIDANAWYPQQKLLDIYNDMASSKSDTMFDFVSIGMKEAAQAIVPPHFSSMPILALLEGIEDVFKLNNRGTNIGEMHCETLDPHHVKMIMRIPQPDDLWYGIFYGYVRRFLPEGTAFKLYYDPDSKRRDEGGDKTIIHVTWG